ncbi:MAG: arginyltransferase [Pseudomonadota bacterium]
MTRHPLDTPTFYLTASSPCPYLPGRQERKIFTHLVGSGARDLHTMLSSGGFRRSQNIVYRPACEGCNACVSVRVVVDEFKPTKSMKRVMAANSDVIARDEPNRATSEQYSLFRDYLDARHELGGMAQMSMLDYAMMIEDSHIDTHITTYRLRRPGDLPGEEGGALIGVCLTDLVADGLSMVYSFFDPDPAMEKRSLGTYLILDHIRRAKERGLPHVYLGYWVNGSPKMAYKARFQPQERLTPSGWRRHNPDKPT